MAGCDHELTWTTFIFERHLYVNDLASNKRSDSDLLEIRIPNIDCSVTVDPKYSYFDLGRRTYYKKLQTAAAEFSNCHFAEN